MGDVNAEIIILVIAVVVYNVAFGYIGIVYLPVVPFWNITKIMGIVNVMFAFILFITLLISDNRDWVKNDKY